MLVPAAAFALALAPGPTCPIDKGVGDEDTVVANMDVSARTQWLRKRIDRGGYRARQWTLGWGISFTLLALGQYGLAPLAPPKRRPDYIVGGTASAIGALNRFIFRPAAMPERRKLRKSTTPIGSCEALAEAEKAMARAARSERRGRHVIQHLIALGFNASVGLVLALAFDRKLQGIRIATTGMLISQVMLITQPKKMVPSLDAYRRGNIGSGKVTMRSAPLVLPGGGGVSIAATF